MKIYIQQLNLILLISFISNMSYAELTPIPSRHDPRIENVAYQENNVVQINGHTFTSTQLVFGKDERVLDVEGGDRDGWIVTYQKNIPNMLFLKPTTLGSDSNMTVVTNRHIYYFHVISNKSIDRPAPATYALKFVYPEEERIALKKILQKQELKRVKKSIAKHEDHAAEQQKIAVTKETNQQSTKPPAIPVVAHNTTKRLLPSNSPNKSPKGLNLNYSSHGSRYIMPLRVYDDGIFTYFEMHPNQPWPAIFIVDSQHGEEEVTNIRRKGNVLVVHRTAPQFTLRMGKTQVASIFNNLEVARLKRMEDSYVRIH